MTDPGFDADGELKAAMAEAGLRPPDGPIIWDRSLQRFPAPGEKTTMRKGASWYRAFPDREGAVFGCYKTGVSQITWQGDKQGRFADMDPYELQKMRERWAKDREKREEERRQEAERAAVDCRARWDRAIPAAPNHPYCLEKGIEVPYEAKMEGDTLLIPCKSIHHGNQIRSLQTVHANGVKLFVEGGEVSGTKVTLNTGKLRPDGRLFITEGWATGCSIHAVTGEPVVVAFGTNNLRCITEEMHKNWGTKFPDLQIIVAADNDRWSKTHRGPTELWNPGVVFAREAAEGLEGVRVAIPDFQGLGGKPTDFNDLYCREGPEAVERWLDPDLADIAITEPVAERHAEPVVEELDAITGPEVEPPADVGEEEEAPKGGATLRDPDWIMEAPFRILGHNAGKYFYLPASTGQFLELSPSAHDRATSLYVLAPHTFWEKHWPSKAGVDWKAVANALIQWSHQAGIFLLDQVRGRGCWPEEDPDGELGTLIHLGDRMIVPGSKKFVTPDTYASRTGYYYENRGRKRGPSNEPMEVEESREILAMFRDLLWCEEASGDLMAGWTALAPVGGALPWRPHVWMVGERGSGKSTVIRDLVVPLLSDCALNVLGETTEAGIRHELGTDAFPVVFDEAEEGEGVGSRIQRVIALARQASSESDARVLKGTAIGSSLQYRVRSMFCFASIGGAVHQEQDKSRVSMLQLKGGSLVSPDQRREHWEEYYPRLIKITPNHGRRLFARMVRALRTGVLQETVRQFRQAGGVVLGDQRSGDQYGTLYAGMWMLHDDEPPGELVAREIVGGTDVQSYREDHRPEGVRALHTLLQRRERVDTSKGPGTFSVGELVWAATGDPKHTAKITPEEAERALGHLGLATEYFGHKHYLLVANNSDWIEGALEGTPYARGIRPVIRQLDGVSAKINAYRFSPGIVSRCSKVPLGVFDQESWSTTNGTGVA